MSARYSAARSSLRTAVIMLVFTLVFTAAMAFIHQLTRPAIEASELQEKMRLINEVLPPGSYDNALLDDSVALGPTPALGLARGGTVYRARLGGEAAALVLEAEAPDGYAGRIQLVLAVAADGRIGGVRVTAHKETPGLGDYIDPRKDRNKERPWIGQFNGAGFDGIARADWKVKRDGGVFDAPTGATISARAVTHATARALAWTLAHRDALFAAAAGDTLDAPKEPTP
ncbi:RnfABCDGE type electron transport complex subunit G [Pseudothauera nasutitermitis]|uniref:Ion-translocating oxidoreductase complex subunit G n=1 Tax=Pseudothauera nasutitermitis TaxID=2565930 RepID=A0A4S4B581_9RHOO|nr:RnfABCDGE type electron transport complex subunit G [Pseudothauera nasutitermitis]THF66956.1 RnfABCDGE type electron transport complex subunit G [Pseudothauera nasutitermitis]